MILYAIVTTHAFRINRASAGITNVGRSYEKRMTDEISVYTQLISYPAIFVLIWVFPTINRVAQTFMSKPSFILTILHSFSSPLQGFLNCLVFSFNPVLYQEKIKDLLCCRQNDSTEITLSTTQDPDSLNPDYTVQDSDYDYVLHTNNEQH